LLSGALDSQPPELTGKRLERSMNVGRRSWLKLAAGGSAGLALSELGFGPTEARAATSGAKLLGAKEFTTACNFCSCGCGMVAHVKDGKLVNLEGDPDHVVNEGSLCSKGAAMRATHESDQRVKNPLYRAPGADAWQEISWDEAIEKIAKKVKQVRDGSWIATEKDKNKDGVEVEYPVNRTDALAFMGGAQNTNEECYLFSKMARLFGTAYVEHQARL
jgi:formate dehydrogenase major subunit